MKGLRNSLKLSAARAAHALAAVALAACAAAARQEELPDVRVLQVGEVVGRELPGQKVHYYMVDLERGESLRVDVEEKGVDCLVGILVSTGGKVRPKLWVSFGGGFDRETITYVAAEEAPHVIMVVSPPGRGGSYRLKSETIQKPGPAELQRAEAVRALAEAVELWGSATDVKRKLACARQLQTCLRLWSGLKEDYWAGHTANRLGRLYTELSQKEKAVGYLNQALELSRKAGDRHGEAVALNNLGVVYGEFGQYTQAAEFFKSSLAIREEVGDHVGRANVLTALGTMYSSTGSPQTAVEYHEWALRILQDAKDDEALANTLSSLATIYKDMGEVPRALDNLDKALALLADTHDINLKSRVLNEIASARVSVGQFKEALDYFRKSLALAEQGGNRQGVARAHMNIGHAHYELGELRAALGHMRKALAIYREVGEEATAALALQNLARIYAALGDERAAISNLREARGLLAGKESEHPQIQAALLLQIGDRLSGNDKFAAAEKVLRRAVTLSHAIGDRGNETAALSSLGHVYRMTGLTGRSIDTYNRAFLLASAMGDSDRVGATMSSLMSLWRGMGNARLAIFHGKLAVNNYQLLRTFIRGMDGETQKSYQRKKEGRYVYLAALLLEQGRHAEALQVINAARDQQHFDFGRDAQARPTQVTLTPGEAALAAAHREASEKVAALGRQRDELGRRAGANPSGEEARRLAGVEKDLKTAEGEFLKVLVRAEAEFSRPAQAGEDGVRVDDLTEMQSILRELSAATGQKTVALYPLAGTGGFRVLLVTADSSHTAASPSDEDRFDRKVLQYYALLQTPALDPRPLGKELYDLIVKPVEPALRASGAQTILWSLGGTLRYVPMASLWDGERYLVEQFQNVVFTRADRERMTRAVSRDWTGVGFGTSRAHAVDLRGDGNKVPFPPLPGVLEELRAVFSPAGRGFVKGEVFVDGGFTRASFLDIAGRRHPLVHVASHFSFRPGDDTQSFLLLGDGTALTLNEMKRQGGLFRGVELLTLSACDTAATRADAMGREIDGFAETAQRLGAGAVMATLWTVADDSTPRLVREFYRARLGGGPSTKAEALRRAQLALLKGAAAAGAPSVARAPAPPAVKVALVNRLGRRKRRVDSASRRGADIVYVEKANAPAFDVGRDKPFAHPYYWAPFVLIGNGR